MGDNTCKDNPMKGYPLPEIDFTTFIMSLSSSALMALGEAPDPSTGKTEFMPQIAKQSIDIIAMLKDKLENGLTDDERKLLCDMLYNLRMNYVNKVK